MEKRQIALCLLVVLLQIGDRTLGQNVQVRLSNNNQESFRGTVEIRFNQTTVWGTICDDQWDIKDANVICKMLGFPSATYAHNESFFGNGVGQPLLDEMQCSGNEDTILNCPRSPGWGTTDCNVVEAAGVTCFNGGITQAPEPATLPNCITRTDVRIADGDNNAVGRVEVLRNGQWGTICDDSWDIYDARVVCRSLCYGSTYAKPVSDLDLAVVSDTVPILLDDVQCTGTENSVGSCLHGGWGVHNCIHKEDALVSCVNYLEGPPQPPAPDVLCDDNNLEVAFNRTIHSALLQDDLSLNFTPFGCTLTRTTNESFVSLKMAYHACAENMTSNATHIIYSATVLYHQGNNAQVITRTHEFEIPVYCTLSRNSSADRPFLPIRQTAAPQWAVGSFNVEMRLYTDDSLRVPVTNYPFNLTLGDWLNVGVVLQSEDPQLKMIVPNCWATPFNSSESSPRYPLISNKCDADDTLTSFPINDTMFSFRLQSFEFVGDYTYVYIHCEVFICTVTEKNAQCDQTCDTTSNRKRREVGDNLFNYPTKEVERGPIFILSKHNNIENDEFEPQPSTARIQTAQLLLPLLALFLVATIL